jgi:TonB-like protein
MGPDETAVDSVRTWRFGPAKKDGNAVRVKINVEVNFHLYRTLLPYCEKRTAKPVLEYVV